MRLLIDHGASLDGVPGTRSIVISALHNGHSESAEFLAQKGAKLDFESAAGLGRLETARSLFEREATPAEREVEYGFVWACEYGRREVVEFLLDRRPDLATAAVDGMTGMHWAVVGAQIEIVRILLNHKASLEAVNKYGGTALGQALWSALHADDEHSYDRVIELLLENGATVTHDLLQWLEQQKDFPSRREHLARIIHAGR
jgi:ankyrin repeat protein